MILILSFMVLRFFVVGFYGMFFSEYLEDILYNFNNVLIIIVPLIFLYLKNLFLNYKKFQWNDLYHLVLPISYIVLDLLDNNIIVNDSFKASSFLFFFLIYVLIYVLVNYKLLYSNLWSKNSFIDTSKYQNRLVKIWTILLFVFLFLLAIRVVFSLLGEISHPISFFGITNILISSLIWFFLFTVLLLNINILRGFQIFKVSE